MPSFAIGGVEAKLTIAKPLAIAPKPSNQIAFIVFPERKMAEQGLSPKKRLALFLDGTWNVVSDNTNVWRLRSLLAPISEDGSEQRAYYSTGLGTKFGERIRGGMFGRGINTAITTAYEWLVDNYEDGNEIFLFGFSRGAYTARSLSGFVSKCGLLQRGAPLGVNQLYTRYRRNTQERTIRELLAASKRQDSKFSFEETWMLKYSRAIPIKFIGVFDTVGALGVPFPFARKILGTAYPFLNTGLRQNNEFAFHAVAFDEHRKAFSPTLWTNMGATSATPRPIEKTEQRWFPGSHANVGGGCFDDPLLEAPVRWLSDKATKLGLRFRSGFANDPAVDAKISDSFGAFLRGWYRVLRLGIRHHRGIDVPPKSEGPGVSVINETIDASVFDRYRANADYRPKALLAWAKKKGVDLAAIKASVSASDPAKEIPK
ncbi:DUF2235 domain-containing protein [Pseudorhodoplanes sp.]|uniref:DUF2235 domain-containing protein n=1 Tax=Pseudorhodoplanes sp. TaxID=1934341 RepID=UPI003919F254